MTDKFGRKIDYLRISITDLCNLRCIYCMPEEGVEKMSHEKILSYEDIIYFVKIFSERDLKKLRLTGGEPLVRPKLEYLVKELKKIESIEELTMTTNGILLEDKAKNLKKAGLDRVNISLDTLDRGKFKKITRRDRLEDVLRGLKAAVKHELKPIKINTVVMKDFNTDEIFDFVDFAIKNGFEWRFIEFMPLGGVKIVQEDYFISNKIIKEKIEEKYDLEKISKPNSLVADVYKIKNTCAKIGFISPLTHKFCHKCNRIRMTADGKVIPCLLSDIDIDISKAVKKRNKNEVEKIIDKILKSKPKEHNFKGYKNMSKMGG